ncbi:response regulator transcription factor [Ornithinimicrobium flavum]|uniref:response regulator transcription factor n=1 Tax=Ornithinimicrobium flavum TaxID=1288636 RepID=UPI00106F9F25|nr:response regulator transcription factor [Ornithinimicrobium flavum]
MIRVAVADDHPVFREGLQLLLDSAEDIEVVGVAADGMELLQLLKDGLEVDVVVLDLDMPVLDGVDAARELSRTRPHVGLLALTMHEDPATVARALAAGVRGYVLKGAGHGAVARAVRGVAEGDTVLGGTVGEAVRRRTLQGGPAIPGLSTREDEVLALVARGLSNHEIARRLFLSVKTVQNNVSALLAKTGARSRAELVARARDVTQG